MLEWRTVSRVTGVVEYVLAYYINRGGLIFPKKYQTKRVPIINTASSLTIE